MQAKWKRKCTFFLAYKWWVYKRNFFLALSRYKSWRWKNNKERMEIYFGAEREEESFHAVFRFIFLLGRREMRGREKLQQHPPSFSPVCDVLQLDLGLFVHNYKNHCCLISFLLSLFFLSPTVARKWKLQIQCPFVGSKLFGFSNTRNEWSGRRAWLIFSHRMEFVSIEWKIPRDDSQFRRYAIKCIYAAMFGVYTVH